MAVMAERQDYRQVDVVQEHLRMATAEVAKWAAAEYAEIMDAQLGDVEYGPALHSPLEALFYLWWSAVVGDNSYWGRVLYLLHQQDVEVSAGKYRLDFVVWLQPDIAYRWDRDGMEWPKIAVEVDGHGFHEKTPEQVTRRDQRDRALQQDGWVVFHFSWTELTSRPQQCIGEVLGVAREHYQRLSAENWKRKNAATSEAPSD
jgi:hypothetical protein